MGGRPGRPGFGIGRRRVSNGRPSVGSRLRRAIVLGILACALSSCDALTTLFGGMTEVKAVAESPEKSLGVKPFVGFNWNNGRLRSVTVTFPQSAETIPFRDLAAAARAAVGGGLQAGP